MKIKYVTALTALGFTLAIPRPCTAASKVAVATPAPQTAPITTAPAAQVPPGYVWDGSEYVGQVGSKYYYVGPHNSWTGLDLTRQHQPEELQTNNPSEQSQQIRNTRYQGHDLGQSQSPNAANPPSQENPQMQENPQ